MMMFTGALTESRVRYLLVVRRGDDSTYRYLKERFASVRDVEITVDRRGTAAPAAAERRTRPSSFNAFGVALVRR